MKPIVIRFVHSVDLIKGDFVYFGKSAARLQELRLWAQKKRYKVHVADFRSIPSQSYNDFDLLLKKWAELTLENFEISPLSSGSSSQTPAFYYFCFLKWLSISSQNIVSPHNEITVLSESSIPVAWMKSWLEEKEFTVVLSAKIAHRERLYLRHLRRLTKRRIFFWTMKSLFLHVWMKFNGYKVLPSGDIKLIRSWWSGGGSVTANQDRNFGELANHLSRQDNTYWWPELFNSKKPHLDWKRLLLSGRSFVSPHAELGILHILKLSRDFKNIFVSNKYWALKKHVDNRRFYAFMWSCEMQGLSVSHFDSCMIGAVAAKWKQNNANVSQLFLSWENNSSEIFWLNQIKSLFPNSKRVALQHTIWVEDQMPYQKWGEWRKKSQSPDELWLMGPQNAIWVEKCGLRCPFKIVGAFRFRSLTHPQSDKTNRAKKLAILLNYDISSAEETFQLLESARREGVDIPYLVKSHPLLPQDWVRQKCAWIRDCEIVSDSVEKLATENQYVLSPGASVTLFEAIHAGASVALASRVLDFTYRPSGVEENVPTIESVQNLQAWLQQTTQKRVELSPIFSVPQL